MLKSANMSTCTGQMCTYIKSKTENGQKNPDTDLGPCDILN